MGTNSTSAAGVPDDLPQSNQSASNLPLDFSSSAIPGGMISPKEFNQISWPAMHERNRVKHMGNPDESALVRSQKEMIESLKRLLAEQEEQLKSEAWMCKACESSFPKSLVRTINQGLMECPRCRSYKAGDIVRAGDAIRIVMKKQLDAKDVVISDLNTKILALEKENNTLKEEAKRRRLRPGEPRTVEEA